MTTSFFGLKWWETPFFVLMSGLICIDMYADFNIYQLNCLIWMLTVYIQSITITAQHKALTHILELMEPR